MAHNNNIGRISSSNISIKGSGNVDVTSDGGSIIGLRYLKDDELGTGSQTTTIQNIGGVALKNWFGEYIGELGKYSKAITDSTNIKWSDYSGATTLGMQIRAANESVSRYKNSNNAKLEIKILNGSGVANSYTVRCNDTVVTDASNNSALSRGSVVYTPGFDSGRSVRITLTDNTTGITMRMTWTTAYNNDNTTIRGSESVAGSGYTWFFDQAGPSTFSEPYIFLTSIQSTRPYGKLSLY
mgnify:CR=1 FL=1|tara:strand:+ start:220 stop:939 length:720 start_codon:yes stop_codon:yes gene_type:complete